MDKWRSYYDSGKSIFSLLKRGYRAPAWNPPIGTGMRHAGNPKAQLE